MSEVPSQDVSEGMTKPPKTEYTGVNPNRQSTDVLCLLLLLATWICMTAVGGAASANSSVYRLIGPVDSEGRVCGINDGVKDLPNFYTVFTYGAGACIETCPTSNLDTTQTTDPSDYICVSAIHSTYSTNALLKQYIAESCVDDAGFYSISSNCGCNVIRQTNKQFHRCRFTDASVSSNYDTQGKYDYFQTFIADVVNARLVIFPFGFLFSLGLSFLFTIVLRYELMADLVIWLSIILVLCAMLEFIVLALELATTWQHANPRVHSTTAVSALRAFSIILMVISILYVCVMVYLRKSINIAVKTISLAARAIDDMPLIVFTPMVQVVGFVFFFLPFIFYCFFLASDGVFENNYYTLPETSETIIISKSYHLAPGIGQRLWFMFFCLLWTMNFIAAIGTLVISIAIALWYFTPAAERSSKNGSAHLLVCYYDALRYHTGTVAFGSLLIALIQLPKYIALYVQHHSKSLSNNVVGKWIVGACICLLTCFEKCLKFISKQAYIQTAIHGSGFLSSTKNSFFLIARNIFTVGAVNAISGLGLLIIKVFVATTVTASAYYWMDRHYENRLHDLVAPTFLVLVISWMTVTMFTDVFHTAIDAILQSYLTDVEANDGRPVFVDAHTQKFIETHGKLEVPEAQVDEKAIATL